MLLLLLPGEEESTMQRRTTMEVLACLGQLRARLAPHFKQLLPELLALMRDGSCRPTQKWALLLLVQSTCTGGGARGETDLHRRLPGSIRHAAAGRLRLGTTVNVLDRGSSTGALVGWIGG